MSPRATPASRKAGTSRRAFLGAAGAGVAAVSLARCERVGRYLRAADAPSVRVKARGASRVVFSICDNCVNKFGIRARVVRGRVV
jgi:hypothetical protein